MPVMDARMVNKRTYGGRIREGEETRILA